MMKRITFITLFLCLYNTVLHTASVSIPPTQLQTIARHRQSCWQRMKRPCCFMLFLGTAVTGIFFWARFLGSLPCREADNKFSSRCEEEPTDMTGKCWSIAASKCPGYFEGADAWCPLNTTRTVTAEDLLHSASGQTFIREHPGARVCVVHRACPFKCTLD